MCGIAGIINRSNSSFGLQEKLLENMHHALAHRGPDGCGTWISERGDVGFAHRRLSVIDLSSAASQPMFSDDRSLVIVFNGEIYNHQQLRIELINRGHTFSSSSDTEVILYSYKEWGVSCLNHFDGMFAFALYDHARDIVFCARDRIGVKPFYFCQANGIFSFASEIKALWQLPHVERRINTNSLHHYLAYLATPAPFTLYRDIYKLPAGFYVVINSSGELSFVEWYSPLKSLIKTPENYIHDEQLAVDTTLNLLRSAVSKRLVSDVPVGVFLSGGLDSSLIVALMAEAGVKPRTFTISFAGNNDQDESAWARRVADHFGAENTLIKIDEEEAFSLFSSMIHYQDEPLGDCIGIPLLAVAKSLKQAGMTVALGGEGADELFGGYPVYKRYTGLSRFYNTTQRNTPAFMRSLAYKAASPFIADKHLHSEVARRWAEGKGLFTTSASVFSAHEIEKHVPLAREHDPIARMMYPAFLGAYQEDFFEYHRALFKKSIPHGDAYQEMLYLELKYRLPELLLARTDKMTMAASVEGREPFLDYHLIEHAFALSSAFKHKNNHAKYILKKAAEKLIPHEIVYRKKVGFASPVTDWFNKGKFFRTYLLDMAYSRSVVDCVKDAPIFAELLFTEGACSASASHKAWVLTQLFATIAS